MHVDEEQLQRLLHGELEPAAESSVREHLAECTGCRGRAGEAEREEDEVYALLREVDHTPPRVTAASIAARARGDVGRFRWAAGVVLALGLAGVAYAAPSSPLPAWVDAVVERIGGRPERVSVPAEAPSPDPGAAGIAVAPGRELVILFTSPQAEGEAVVSLTDGAQVVVRARSGAAIFTSDVGRLVIDNRGPSADFEIQIPRAAPRVEIRVDGDRIFLKEGPRVTTEKSAEARGSYLLPLRSSPRRQLQ